MKKLILSLVIVACGNAHPQKDIPTRDTVWVVEDMYYGTFMRVKQRFFDVSNIATGEEKVISVGRYTFDHTVIGDTIFF